MNPGQAERGFTLVSALFLITVVATLGVTLSQLTVGGEVNSARDIQAGRAYYAARSALEFVISTIDNDPAKACPTTPGTIEGFTIRIDLCTPADVNEAGTLYRVFDLQITALSGTRGDSNLVRRTLRSGVRFDAP